MIKKSIITVTIAIIIIMIYIIVTFNIQTNIKLNKIMQINLNQIYQYICIIDNENIELSEEEINEFTTGCYTATKTICAIENSDYDLDDFYFFLLYLRDFENYNLEKKEKVIEAIQLIHEEFYKVSWHTTKGLGIDGYYDFISKDSNKIKELVSNINMISESAIN